MIESLFSGLLDVLVVATGRWALKLSGRKDPNEFTSMLAGLAFWILVGFAILDLSVKLGG